MKKFLSYKAITGLHLQLFWGWSLAALLLELTNQLQLTYAIPDNYTLGYGVTRPILHLALLFGAGLNLFFAHSYAVVERKEKGNLPLPVLGLAALLILNLTLLGGALAIVLRWNGGRDYAEIPFLFANGVLLAALLCISMLVVGLWKKESVSLDAGSATFILGGFAACYFLGNLGLPIHPFQVVSFFQGIQDAALQEFYRTGLLAFAVILPVVAVLSAWRADPVSNRAGLALLFGVIGAGTLFGGWAGLVHSPAPGLIQTAGSTAGLFLAVAILGAAVLLWQLAATQRVDDRRLIQRFASIGLLVFSIVLGFSSLRSGAALFQYSFLNSKDLASLAFLLLIPAGIAFSQSITGNSRSGWPLASLLTGLAISLASDILQGSIQAFAEPAETWLGHAFAGQLFVNTDSSLPAHYWYSMRSLYFLGRLLSVVGLVSFLLHSPTPASGSADEYLLVEADR